MLNRLLRQLTSPAPDPLDGADARAALGALLVRIAKADGEYSEGEIARIDRVLALRYGLNPVEAAELRAECEAIEHEAPDTVRFTRAIKAAVDYEDRAGVIEAMWSVAKQHYLKRLLLEKQPLTQDRFEELVMSSLERIKNARLNGVLRANLSYIRELLTL